MACLLHSGLIKDCGEMRLQDNGGFGAASPWGMASLLLQWTLNTAFPHLYWRTLLLTLSLLDYSPAQPRHMFNPDVFQARCLTVFFGPVSCSGSGAETR